MLLFPPFPPIIVESFNLWVSTKEYFWITNFWWRKLKQLSKEYKRNIWRIMCYYSIIVLLLKKENMYVVCVCVCVCVCVFAYGFLECHRIIIFHITFLLRSEVTRCCSCETWLKLCFWATRHYHIKGQADQDALVCFKIHLSRTHFLISYTSIGQDRGRHTNRLEEFTFDKLENRNHK